MRIHVLSGALALGLLAAPAGAVTFATYNQIGTAPTISYGSGALGSASQVRFSFTNPTLIAAGLTDLLANFTLAFTTATAPSTFAGFVLQPGFSGMFSFTYAGATPLVVGGTTYATGSTLLSGILSGAMVAGPAGSTSGGLTASEATAGTTITYASSILGFGGGIDDFSIGLSSISPGLILTSGLLSSFTASSTGSFGSSLVPAIPLVPEPATWAMMLLGFGLLGTAVRRRGTRSVLA